MKHLLFFTLLFFTPSLNADKIALSESNLENFITLDTYLSLMVALPTIDEEQRQQITPFLLPDNFKVKKKLDVLLSKIRFVSSYDAIYLAGFETKGLTSYNNTYVAKHPNLKGFVFKFYLDTQHDKDDFRKLFRRIKGAEIVRSFIVKQGWQKYFKVPQKWIYVIPANGPAPYPSSSPKSFILVAEDMHIYKKPDNYDRWKSHHVNEALLDKVFILLRDCGLSDSAYAFNLPFAKDGTIAVIDTEHFSQPVPYMKLEKYLSKKMKIYWKTLIEQGGPS